MTTGLKQKFMEIGTVRINDELCSYYLWDTIKCANVQNATDSDPYLSVIIIFDTGVIAIVSIQRGSW